MKKFPSGSAVQNATPTRAQSDPRVSDFRAVAGDCIIGNVSWFAVGGIGGDAASTSNGGSRVSVKIRVLLLNRSRENEF